jgi:hypothetical protein
MLHRRRCSVILLGFVFLHVNRLVNCLCIFSVVQCDQQGLKLLAANDSKIFPKYEIFLCVSVGTRCKL